MYFIHQVDSATANSYESLTFTDYYPILRRVGSDENVVAVAASNFSRLPVGLALGERSPNGELQIYSIFVKPKFRLMGVATALIEQMEEVARRQECSSISFGYIEDHEFHRAFEKLLEKCHWELPPQTEMLLYKMDLGKFTEDQAPIFTTMEFPAHVTPFLWNEIKNLELKELRQGEGLWYPRSLSPFLEEELIEPVHSLGLKDEKGNIIGWAIARRLDFETMLIRNVFVKEEFRHLGYAMLLLGEAICKQYEQGIYKLMFCVHVKNSSMAKIVRRFMKPFEHEVKEKLGIRKLI